MAAQQKHLRLLLDAGDWDILCEGMLSEASQLDNPGTLVTPVIARSTCVENVRQRMNSFCK